MDLKGKIDIFEDYPIEGISFKDINSLIADGEAFQYVVNQFYDIAKTMDANLVGIPESRGYIFGSPLAYYGCDSAKAVAFTIGITEEP